MVIHFGFSAKIVNVETAFLYGDLEEKIYMECPQSMSDVGKNDCILNKCLYSLVLAKRRYYKEDIEILKKLGLIGGNVDPCLYVTRSKNGIVYVVLYLNNNLMTGDIEAIDNTITALKENWLVLKVVEGLQDFLSCKVKLSVDKKRACLGQPHLIENLEKKFGN